MESSLQFHRGASCLFVAPFIGIRIPPIGFPRSCDTWIFYKGISGAITVSDVIRQVFQLVRKSVCKERSGFGKNGWLRFSIAMFRIFKRRMCIVLPKIKMEKSLFHSSYQLYSWYSIYLKELNLFNRTSNSFRTLLKIPNSPNPSRNLIATLVTNLNCSWKLINQRGNVS